MILSADTNLFLYSLNPQSTHHEQSKRFFAEHASGKPRFVICGLVLVEVYMQLRNPAILKKPLSAKHAAKVCETLRTNPSWEFGDYESEIGGSLWRWAEDSTTGFRHIIDARLALTLRHHGVTHFATANVADFVGFDFVKVWNPLLADPP